MRTVRVQTYTQTGVLETVRNRLLEVGGEDLLNEFREGCFGHLIDWEPRHKIGMAIHNILLCKIEKKGVPEAPEDEMWFRFCGNDLFFSPRDYALVTGLKFRCSRNDTAPDHLLNNIALVKYFRIGTRMDPSTLLEKFTESRADERENGDHYLRAANVLVLYYFVLGIFRQKGRRPVDSWVWKLVDDLKHFDRYPWGAYSYLTLCHNLRLVKHKTSEKNYNFFGPVWALYVWALELVPGMAALTAICLRPSALPRCLKWQFLSIIKGPRGMKPEEKNKALHEVFVKVVFIPNISLTPEEIGKPYWRSVLRTNSLGVNFAVRVNRPRDGQVQEEAISDSDDEDASSRLQIVPCTVQQEGEYVPMKMDLITFHENVESQVSESSGSDSDVILISESHSDVLDDPDLGEETTTPEKNAIENERGEGFGVEVEDDAITPDTRNLLREEDKDLKSYQKDERKKREHAQPMDFRIPKKRRTTYNVPDESKSESTGVNWRAWKTWLFNKFMSWF